MRLETKDFVFTIFRTRFCPAVLVRVYPNTVGGYPPPARKVVQLLRGVNPPEPKSNEKQVLLLIRWGGVTPPCTDARSSASFCTSLRGGSCTWLALDWFQAVDALWKYACKWELISEVGGMRPPRSPRPGNEKRIG